MEATRLFLAATDFSRDAARQILRAAEEDGADLVVVGKRGESALQEALLGSVTRHVLSAASCDVLVAGAEPLELASVEV